MKIDIGALSAEMGKNREKILEAALSDARIQCPAPPALVGKKPSEQHWIDVFSDESAIDNASAKKFISSFQLQRSSWKYDEIETIFLSIISDTAFIPNLSVGKHAGALGKYKNPRKQKVKDKQASTPSTSTSERVSDSMVSAASKISLFAKPLEEILIWDKLAVTALRWRLGRPFKLSRNFSTNGAADYAAFNSAAIAAFKTECRDGDFSRYAEKFVQFITETGGPMAFLPEEFLLRRYFDKVLFMEGRELIPLLEAAREEERQRRQRN